MSAEDARVEVPKPRSAGVVAAQIEPTRAVVTLAGEVDLSVAPELGRLAREVSAVGVPVVLDTSALTFCDTTVLGFVAALAAVVQVTVTPPTGLLVELLTMVDMKDRITVAETIVTE